MRLLREIDKGSLDDPQDNLFVLLLRALYPAVLSVGEVQAYLRTPKPTDQAGEYARFWTWHVPKESAPDQLAELLDGIAARFEDFRPFMVDETGLYNDLGQLPALLLTEVLRPTVFRPTPTKIAVDRLYNWLSVASDQGLRMSEANKVQVRAYLEWNSEALKELISYGIETCLRTCDDCMGLIDRRLFGARPFDYGRWCLEMVLDAEDGRAASFYLRELIDCIDEGSRTGGLTVEAVRAALAADDSLLQRFDEMGSPSVSRVIQLEHVEIPESPVDTEDQKAWQAWITAAAQALRAGSGAPQLLFKTAEVYLNICADAARKTPRERLGQLVGSRTDLIDLLMLGIERTVARDDLPRCDDVVRLFDENRIDWLVLPLIAGMHSLEQSGRLALGDLGESRIRLAVTILYTLPGKVIDPDNGTGRDVYRPEWFRDLLREEPGLIADVLRRSAKVKLETGVQPAVELRELAVADDHRGVAAIVSLPVLESVPTAETDNALISLCWSLNAALRSCDWSEVGRVVGERLGTSDQAPEERACWLTAGYLLDPEQYREVFQDLASDDQGLKWLSRFVAIAHFPKDFTRQFATHDFEPFIVVLGAALKRVGLSEKAFWNTSNLIETLGDDPSVAATEALDALSRASDAKPWSPTISEAREDQARKRRERQFRYGDIRQVVGTLENGAPANAGDLGALVFDELNDLAVKIRDGSTSDWRQHWNVDHHNRPTDPKPEDACRDALLSDLQERLGRKGIDAQPEGAYAEDKRSDIRVSFGGFNVPVEIKRSCHPDLWTAVRSQLIAKYTRDPGAEGYGIYLVFWFGDTEKCWPTKRSGWTPETAEDVRVRIEQSLDDREARLISVGVVDVSMPP